MDNGLVSDPWMTGQSQENLLTKRAIHVPAMAGIVDDNRMRLRIHFIHDAVIADSKTIEMFRAAQF